MGPLALAISPAHRTVGEGHGAVENQGPAQSLTGPIVGSCVHDQAHEDVPNAVDRHQAVDHAVKCCIGGRLELEKGEAMIGAYNSVDAEADGNSCNCSCEKIKNG